MKMKKLFLILVLFFIAVSAWGADVTLTWDANTDDVDGYKMYMSGTSGGYDVDIFTDVGNVTAFTQTGLPENTEMFFSITAYKAGKNDSDFSNEVSCGTIVDVPGNLMVTCP